MSLCLLPSGSMFLEWLLMDLIVKNIKGNDGKIIKALFIEVNGVETAIAYARDFGFSTVYPLDRSSEDNARLVLEKAVRENFEGNATELMKKKEPEPILRL